MRTGSLVVIRVTEVLRMICFVSAAMCASSVGGDDGTNGGLWCSPSAKTSRPTSSARCAIRTRLLIRSASLWVSPVTGLGAMSPTVKIPNCTMSAFLRC